MRAAASSMASGKPSRRRQMSATAAASAGIRTKSSRRAWARETNSRTASDRSASSTEGARPGSANPSGGTACSCSPEIWSRTRLVARTVSPGQPPSRSATSGAAATRCSKLSSTSSSRRSRRNAISRSTIVSSPATRTPRTWAMADATRSGSEIEAKPTNHTPPGKSSTRSAATRIASRVFPTPPGPVRVSRRRSGRRSHGTRAATSPSRPTSDVSGVGKVVARSDGAEMGIDLDHSREETSPSPHDAVRPVPSQSLRLVWVSVSMPALR